MKFLDANVFLRFITRDDELKAAACRDLLQRIERGEEEATTCEAVVAEVVYVLTRSGIYSATRQDVVNSLRPLLELAGLRIQRKPVYLHALDLYVAHPGLDLEDALIVAHATDQGVDEIVSYDHDFDRIPGVTRVEP